MEVNSYSQPRAVTQDRTWVTVFVFAFLGLMVDGADLMFLSYSLSSLKQEFGLSNVQAGALGSVTLAGMAIGGVYGGWAADRFGPVIVLWHTLGNIVYPMTTFGFLYSMPYGVNATYMTESFETRIRGSAVGGAYNVGRIGAAVAPAAIGLLATGGTIGLGFLVMGVAYFLCGLVPALCIKEKLYDPQKD
ncbi:MFS transporter [Mycetohabitans rhizoxinica]|uniref:MFS transporter n=1 Tax=Mycetohabitans rhizoxinica TaxID=412963 RepID=UPI0030D46B77